MEERLLESIVDDYLPIGSKESGFTLEVTSDSVVVREEGAFATLRLIIWERSGEDFNLRDIKEKQALVAPRICLDSAVALREWLDDVVERAGEITKKDAAVMMPDDFIVPPEPDPVVDAIGPTAARLAPDSILVYPRRGECAADESKIGGEILWLEGRGFPRCEEHDMEMLPVIQLRRDDVPLVPFPEGTDLFQLLWCPHFHEEGSPSWGPAHRVFWRNSSGELLVSRKTSTDRDDVDYPGFVPIPCQLEFEMCPGDIEEGRVARGTKVGGVPHWVQNPDYPICDCGEVMQHVLTIADWGPETSQRRRVAAHRAEGSGGRVEPWDSPTGLQLGDVASLYYFICSECEERPIQGRYQTH